MAGDSSAIADRLYSRLPEIYRSRDLAVAQQALPGADDTVVLNARPLLALITAIASQVASVRQDMDDLWDNFFVDTADDWVVPYIGALLGTNLLPNEVEQSQRLDVRNTIPWRRSKGTPAQLAAVVSATTGWRSEVVEFLGSMLWVQSLRHLRMARPVTVSMRDRFALSRLGHADDPFLHSPDVRTPPEPGQSAARLGFSAGRVGTGEERQAAALGRPSLGTTGRYGTRNLGVFIRRQPTFRVAGATPAPVVPKGEGPVTTYAFDPLGRDVPLFCASTGAPIERAQVDHAPERHFGASDSMDVSIRRLGVPVAVAAAAQATPSRSSTPFKFAGNPELRLHPTEGLRLLQPRAFGLAGQSFVVNAVWRPSDGSGDFWLGGVSTLLTRLGRSGEAFRAAAAGTPLDGQLVIRIQVADPSLGWPQLSAGPTAYFPETVLAVRDDVPFPRTVHGASDSAYQDALLVYLPGALVTPESPVDLFVAADGATYSNQDMTIRGNLARPSQGQLWPAADLSRPSVSPAPIVPQLHRKRGLAIADPGRFDPSTPIRIEACVDTGVEGSVPQEEGGLITGQLPPGSQPPPVYPAGAWQPYEYHASIQAITDQMPTAGQRLVRVTAQSVPGYCPQFEAVLTDRAGNALLCYLPETVFSDVMRQQEYLIRDDGSSYVRPGPGESQPRLARISAGQALPVEGAYPLRRRTVCSGRPPAAGEVAIDPERGFFSLLADDPIVVDLAPDQRALTVDYVESFADEIGARAFSRGIDYVTEPATRIVAATGDAATSLPPVRIHPTLQDAIDHAADGEVIEIADSATYVESCSIALSPSVRNLTIRAADQPGFMRPCLVSAGGPAITVAGQPSSRLELSGLLISGGPLQVRDELTELVVAACTFDVADTGTVSIAAGDEQPDHRARYLVCRSLLGAVYTGQGIEQLLVADSVLDNRGGLAIGGLLGDGSGVDPPARSVQLERVTVLGRVRCESLVASESILAGGAYVDDRQSGCLRFTRFDPASADHLPRRFRCVTDPPTFASSIQWRPAYAQLGPTAAGSLSTASERGDVVGSFASTRSRTRLSNLQAKLREFLPVGLTPLVVAET